MVYSLIVGTAADASCYYLVAFGDLLLDAEVEVGRSGSQLSYRSLVTFFADFFPCKEVMVHEGRSQQFVSYV